MISNEEMKSGNILHLFWKFALPAVVGVLVAGIQGIIDGFFIGNAIGSHGLAGITLAYPPYLAIIGAGIIIGIGSSSLIALKLGEENTGESLEIMNNAFPLCLLAGVIFTAGGLIFCKTSINLLGTSGPALSFAREYLYVIFAGSVFMILAVALEPLVRNDGKPKLCMKIMVAGVLANVVLDYLFVMHLKRKNGLLGRFRFLIRPRRKFTLNILKLGLPVAAMNVYFAFINMNLARTASVYGGHLGITSQSIGGQIEGITWNTSNGFSTALGSFVAQNYAASKMQRATRAFRYTLLMMGALGVVVTVAFVWFGEEIFSLFVQEREAYQAGGDYLMILGLSQLFMMLEITTQGMFNGLGKTTPPAIISIFLNTLRIPLAIFLGVRIGVTGVWWAITITSLFKGSILFIWYLILKKRLTDSVETHSHH